MMRPRFEVVALRYGCHEGEWEIPNGDRPVVIAGPNGSGKSTLVGGLVRTLFGFDRRRSEDSAEVEARRPWEGEGVWGRVVLARNGDRFEIQRDFDTGRVRLFDPAAGVERFSGDGNPAGRNQEARHYRQLLGELLGLRELEAYRQTLLVRQGDLHRVALGEHLLRIAAGGHARVDGARHKIAEAHRSITRRPLHPAAAPAINPRALEKLDEEIAAVRARLDAAREASERRVPLTLDRERVADRLAVLDRDILLLEDARSALARTDATELNTRSLRREIQQLQDAQRQLEQAMRELDDAQAARTDALHGGRYPADFPERMARAEVRWRDMEELRRPTMPWLRVVALAGMAAAALLFAAGYTLPAAAAGAVAVLAAAGAAALALGARRRRSAARREVDDLLAGVPRGDSLGPATRIRALAAFQAQDRAERRWEEAREELAEAMRDARAALRESEAPERDADGSAAAGRGASGGEVRGRRLLERLEEAMEAARDRLAVGRVELDRIGDLSLALPGDVAPTEESVAAALGARRAERLEVQESLRTMSQALLERGTPSESVEALETLLSSLQSRRDKLAVKAEVLEAAHALILDAYDAFRDHDQDRLTHRISTRVAQLGAGRMEGVHVDGSLDEARVRMAGRLLPMASPPLSYGELHALQLGVRLGAADFLAGLGILPPLIIDEPFAHLDSDRGRGVWRLLEEVAAERQVIVTTQDTRLLEELGVPPDIRLGHQGDPVRHPRLSAAS